MTHVLIVEDHEENRNLLKLLLEANGYRVTAAGDGLEALAAARRDPPDVIVSDALMPKMDGFTLCRAWTQDAALKAIPFIFYSATYVQPEDEQFAAALGAVRYLIKPLEAEVFLRELRAVLEQWAGQTAPAPAAPLDDATARALHESALARKVEDKMAQLEAANRELQESEARFRSLTEMTTDFYWETDIEHRLTQRGVASKSSAVTVLQRPTQIGERRWEIPCLSPNEAGWQAHRTVLGAHQPFRNFEFSRLGTDGTEHFLSISGDPLFDASGAFTGYRGVGTDITERKRAERALEESEERLRTIFEGALDGILVADAETGKFVSGNAEICRMLSYTLAELVCLGVPDIHRKQDLPYVMEQFGQLVRGGSNLSPDIPVMRKDGSVFYAAIKSAHIRIAGKDGLLGIFRDVTERKRMETAMRDSEERFRSIVQNAVGAILIRNARGEAIYASPQCERVLGLPPEAFLGRTRLAGIVHPADRTRWEEMWETLHRTGEGIRDVEYRVMLPDGSYHWVSCTAGSITLPDGTRGVQTNVRDITERKRADDALRDSSRRLRQLSRRLIEIEDTVRRTINRELHDRVGASLSALNLNLSIVRSQLPPEALPAVGARLDDAQKLLEETTTQVRDLMADLHPPALDDYGLLAALRTYVHDLGTRVDVPISVNGDDIAPRLPLAAETALFRVAQGALANAVAHAQAKRIQVQLAETPDGVTLTIADDGAGFDVAHASLTHASWGLAIMRERAQAVGAELSVESEPGEGTRVRVEIQREKR